MQPIENVNLKNIVGKDAQATGKTTSLERVMKQSPMSISRTSFQLKRTAVV